MQVSSHKNHYDLAFAIAGVNELMGSKPTFKSSYLLISLVVLTLDQWSKYMVERYLPEHVPHQIIPGFLALTHVKNTGVAFGLFAAHGSLWPTVILTVLGLAALTIVGIYFWKTPAGDWRMLTALSLILGGAIGNLLDRVASGQVTDFIDAYFENYHWHTFNIADSAITIGICLMAIDILVSRKDKEPASETESTATS